MPNSPHWAGLRAGISRSSLTYLVLLWTLGITLARAIRTPNDYSEAHWLLDYRFGFIKRGLIGSMCSLAARGGSTFSELRWYPRVEAAKGSLSWVFRAKQPESVRTGP